MRLGWSCFIVHLLLACAEPKTGRFRDEDLSVNAPVTSEGLELLKPGTEWAFGMGSLLVWDPAVESQAVHDMIELNQQRRTIQQEILRIRAEDIIAGEGEELLNLSAAGEALETERAKALDSERRRRAKEWFESELGNLSGEFDRARSRDMFAMYCQAKVWERALDPTLIQQTFSRRPTPLALCEEVYRQLRLFEYGEAIGDCEPQTEERDYFSCLWTHGVMKTPLFQFYRYGADPTSAAAFRQLDAQLLKANLIWDPSLRTKILQQKKIRLFAENGAVEPVLVVEASPKVALAHFEDDSVFSIIFNLENRRKRFLIVGAAGAELSGEMVAQLSAMAKVSTVISQNEYWFNLPYNQSDTEPLPLPDGAETERVAAQFKNVLAAEAPAHDAQIATVQQQTARIRTSLLPRLMRVMPEECGPQSDNLLCREVAVQKSSVALARRPEVGMALLVNVAMRIWRNRNDQMCAALRWDAREPDEREVCAVPDDAQFADKAQASVRTLTLEFEPNNSEMRLLQIGNRRSEQPADAIEFNDMTADDWRVPLTLELDLQEWSGKDRRLSNILQGRIFARRDSEKIWVGSLFLRELAPPSQTNFQRVADLVLQATAQKSIDVHANR
jgi:hypothetical protein